MSASASAVSACLLNTVSHNTLSLRIKFGLADVCGIFNNVSNGIEGRGGVTRGRGEDIVYA